MIQLTSTVTRTPRVMQLEGMFDLQPSKTETVNVPELPVDRLDERDWNIGLVVGPSGSGKSTVAREAFGEPRELTWPIDRAVIDGFPDDAPMADVTEILSSVGFSSPPAWRRPFHVLSMGEQFRVTMARLLVEADGLVVVDEFTSVVDRQVAQIGSAAIARTVRRRGQRFVAVTCHYDVEDWLQPDWLYQPHTGEFTWRSVQPRPRVDVEVIRATSAAWPTFAPHHYLDAALNRSAVILVGLVDDQPAVLCAMLGFPHRSYKRARRVHRIVVMPDYQGVGLGMSMLAHVGGAYRSLDTELLITSSHPAIVRSLNRSPEWAMTSGRPRRTPKDVGALASMSSSRASNRLVSSFRYAGPARPELSDLLIGLGPKP